MSAAQEFQLDPRLAADTVALGDLPASRLLLMNDRRFPWCILVPRRAGLTELYHLPAPDRTALLEEIDAVSRALIGQCAVAKINVGALGNLVAQLHVHVVGRTPQDAAWPGPVWGSGTAEPYDQATLERLTARLRTALGL
jgi:diadenosine tetraphosphate (Ap4A) HIT family hydrolase